MSKYIHFTERQKTAARQVDLASFLQSRGEALKRSGSEVEWVGHYITLRGNQYYDHYTQRGGTAVDFVREQYGMSYPEAVQLLLGYGADAAPIFEPHPKPRPAFELPPKNDTMRRVYAYLMKQRCISRDIIHHFARRGLIYEDTQYHNAVFVGTDTNGTPRHTHKKSTSLNNSSFRANQAGSDAAFSFHHTGQSGRIYAFEAPIDLLSFLTLYPKGWQEHSYVALCSVSGRALFRLLEDNPHIVNVALCLDNDDAGRQAMEHITAKLAERGYYDVSVILPQNKDWNEDLVKAAHGLMPVPDGEPESAEEQTGGLVML